jgi:hypothetical protein
MARQPIRIRRQRWWLNVPVLVGAFVLFMALAAISGSLGTREQRSNGNAYWELFFRAPLVGLERLAVIGTWRQDRRRSEEIGPAHCGMKIYALPPGEGRAFFIDPLPEDALWSLEGETGPLNTMTRMSGSFCGGPETLMDTIHGRILTAWREPLNERFCSVYERTGAIFAGVIDRDTGRVYTWFSAEDGPGLTEALDMASFTRCEAAG